jgi:hypothetical protein
MSARSVRWLAWGVWAVSLALAVLGTAMYLARPTDLSDGIVPVVFLAFASVGAIVAYNCPDNPLGWIFLFIGFSNSLWTPTYEYASLVSAMPSPDPGSFALSGGLTMLADTIGTLGWEMIILAILVFPDGRLPSKRWRPVVWLAIVLISMDALVAMLNPGQRNELPATVNPIGVESLEEVIFIWQNYIAMPIFLLILGACTASLVLRFLRARGDERQQIKWVVYATVLVVLGLVLNAANLILGFPVPSWSTLTLLITAYMWLPISVGIAILKFRLYNIDLLINRTLVYGLLTGTLVAVYVVIVVLVQEILSPITGRGSDFAIAISTLAIAALFMPLRRWTQGFIDRRFYRRKYDAAMTLQAFSATLRDEVDLEKLTSELVEVVHNTMQPSHISVWLVEREQTREATAP